jgi:molybdenum cofactor synthesis domain-containing protein
MKTPTATVLIVGNEVLSAKVQDENGPYAARALHDRGIELTALLTLPDELDVLVEALTRERTRVDWLFTSGGVGPTHDDVTVLAVARALGRPLARHPELAENIRSWHRRRGSEPSEAAMRMADVPEGTRLKGDPHHPVMFAENVVMLPGPPPFFRTQLDAFVVDIEAPPYSLACLFLLLREDAFARSLEGVARAHPRVDVGSYPRFDEADHRVKVTFESKDAEEVEAALDAFLRVLPEGSVVRREGP